MTEKGSDGAQTLLAMSRDLHGVVGTRSCLIVWGKGDSLKSHLAALPRKLEILILWCIDDIFLRLFIK